MFERPLHQEIDRQRQTEVDPEKHEIDEGAADRVLVHDAHEIGRDRKRNDAEHRDLEPGRPTSESCAVAARAARYKSCGNRVDEDLHEHVAGCDRSLHVLDEDRLAVERDRVLDHIAAVINREDRTSGHGRVKRKFQMFEDRRGDVRERDDSLAPSGCRLESSAVLEARPPYCGNPEVGLLLEPRRRGRDHDHEILREIDRANNRRQQLVGREQRLLPLGGKLSAFREFEFVDARQVAGIDERDAAL